MEDFTPAQRGVLELHLHCPQPPEPVLYLRTATGDWRRFTSMPDAVRTGNVIDGADGEEVIEQLEQLDAGSRHAGIVWGEVQRE